MARYQIGSGSVSGEEKIVLCTEGLYVDLVALLTDDDARKALPNVADGAVPSSLMDVVRRWDRWKGGLSDAAAYALDRQEDGGLVGELDEAEIRWLPPLMYPSKLVCIGSNYTDHVAEMGFVPEQEFPCSFLKPATNTLVGHKGTVRLPGRAKMIDWEAELAVVIGRKAKNVRGEEAMAAVAGYSVFNDVSARDWVEDRTFMGFDWIMLKAFDTSGPMGPLITPAEFVPDPQALTISLSVNGEMKQDSHTSRMIFPVRALVEHLSAFMTLEPGDVIATGSPAGVGFGMKPREFLRGRNATLISPISVEGTGPSMSIEGSSDTDFFGLYIRTTLAPRLKKVQIVLMDNLSIHKSKRVRDLIEEVASPKTVLAVDQSDYELAQPAGCYHVEEAGELHRRRVVLNVSINWGWAATKIRTIPMPPSLPTRSTSRTSKASRNRASMAACVSKETSWLGVAPFQP